MGSQGKAHPELPVKLLVHLKLREVLSSHQACHRSTIDDAFCHTQPRGLARIQLVRVLSSMLRQCVQ
jgi:hypothetical protein